MGDSESVVHRISQYNLWFNRLRALNRIQGKNKSDSEKFRIRGNNLFRQKKHDQTQHKELISLYTASIAFAPEDSDELAKGFGNRSAALMHLHLYEEALVDIDRALLISKSDDLKAKLTQRKDRCLNSKGESDVKQLPDKLPEIVPSKVLPNASEAVVIEYNENFGRHLVATRDIKPGEVVIVEQSYACFPQENKIYTVCSHCLRYVWNGIPCDTCVFAIFCSEECKNEAWQEYHDIECSVIPLIFGSVDDGHIMEAMIILRAFLKAVKSEGFSCVMNEIEISDGKEDHVEKLLYDGILDNTKFRSFYNLQFDTEVYKDENVKFLDLNISSTIITVLLRHTTVISNNNKLEDLDSLDHEVINSLCNAFMRSRNILRLNSKMYQASFCDCTDINIHKNSCGLDSGSGELVAVTCSLVNHSCCPNVRRIFLPKRKIVMYATAPIKKGQQLCDSYGPNFSQRKEERQRFLIERFHFSCTCQACEEEWSIEDIFSEISKNPIPSISNKFIRDFNNHFSNEKLVPITEFIDQRYYEKSAIVPAMIFFNFIYSHFDYRTAYYHCLGFSKSTVNKTFFELYGQKCIIPKNC